jgi:hypothetical protein
MSKEEVSPSGSETTTKTPSLEKLVELVGKCLEDKGLLWNIESKELKTLQFRETRFNMMTKLPDKDKLELELSSIPSLMGSH